MILLLSLLALADGTDDAFPDPLPTPAFALPTPSTHRLTNGLEVRVVENHEVPLFTAELRFMFGSANDPSGQEGVASVTLDLMDQGTTTRSAEDLARALKQLGSSLSTGADTDVSLLRAAGLTRNLGPTLDLMLDVLQNPTFPEAEWEIIRAQRVADVRAAREDAPTVARNAFYTLLYGGEYLGRNPDEASYGAITREHMVEARERLIAAEAVLLVGGDVDPEVVIPELEARFGGLTIGTVAPTEPVAAAPQGGVVYFIDKPGAAQSVVRVGGFIGRRTDDDHHALLLANLALGGAFTSRVNMNLREDKGYTYGARCRTLYPRGDGVWFCTTNVQTEVTGPSLVELDREIREVLADRPITSDEVAYYQSSEINGFPGGFETTGAILGQFADIWLYDLPADTTERYLPELRAVTVDSANAALKARIEPAQLLWVVVGDRATVRDDLDVLGLPVRELDRDGNPFEGG